VTSIISSSLVQKFASLGTTAPLEIAAAPVSLTLRTDGIVLHGNLAVSRMSAPPVARLTFLPAASPTDRVLHAGMSWAPGANITKCHWEFGDGEQVTTSDANVRLVEAHSFQAGSHTVCVTVTSDRGETARVCAHCTVGFLTPELVAVEGADKSGDWGVCATDGPVGLTVKITDDGIPVRNVTVETMTAAGAVSVRTGIDGLARVQLGAADFQPVSDAGPYHLGRAAITATKDGYAPVHTDVDMVDCEAIRAAYSDISLIRDRIHEMLRLLDVKFPIPRDRFTPFEPRAVAYGVNIEVAMDVLTSLIKLAAAGDSVLPLAELLGVAAGRHSKREVVTRLQKLQAVVAKNIEAARVRPSSQSREK
jgi:hypothetical protein